MTNPYRAMCAELVRRWDSANGDHDLIDVADAMDRTRALLAQPEPEGPTDEELASFLAERYRTRMENKSPFGCPDFDGAEAKAAQIADARAVLARYGRSTPQPVAVSERPWERDGWCDAEGRCYGWDGDYWWMVSNSGIPKLKYGFSHWLPANALPTPEATND